MFLKLVSIEWIRISRRALLWLSLAVCAAYAALSLSNFYDLNRISLLDGTQKMPGVAFDLANSLDQLVIASPLLVIMAGILMGSDYSQRTNQHWLMRASRTSSLLARFVMLGIAAFSIQALTMLVGGLVGLYFKGSIYHNYSLANLNLSASLAAPFYMTLVNLPYVALTLLLTVAMRSAFFGVIAGLGYTQIFELLLAAIFHGKDWTRWLFTNLHFSASFLLNSIGNRTVELPAHILTPAPALAASAAYTIILLVLAIWLYQRQNVGG
jgi:hypothetical protein